ncbi:histidine kinase [Piscinibacter terrae]|uniref:hypothetical protein n=1 Tax=Piscinibacter terrae TaxID=2496871 RepID=UPI0018E0A779|nr:hypothetical protein [Albitalea terrae]
MDMSDLNRSSSPAPGTHSPGPSSRDTEADRWRETVNAVGGEIASPLTAALERIHALTTTGRIDKAGLRALREEVEAARRAGMIAQQLTRFASGRLRQSHEQLVLADTLNAVLQHRSRETAARGIVVRPSLKTAEVVVDPSLLYSLINNVLDWSLAHARSDIEFVVDMKAWPAHARLACHFSHRPPDELDDGAPSPASLPALDSLTWRLIEQTAWTMGLPIHRSVDAGRASLTIEFPRVAAEQVEGLSAVEMDTGFGLSANSRPLAGSHVLVIASRREMRVRIRDAIRHMGLVIDLVSSIEEAADFCRDSLPHGIVVEGILVGDRLNHLRQEICADVPDFPFVEIIEEGASFSMSGFGGSAMGRVGREAIESALPSVLMFELSRGL